MKIGDEAGAAVSILEGLPDPAAPLDPPLLSEAKKMYLKYFPPNIGIHTSNFDCVFTKFRL